MLLVALLFTRVKLPEISSDDDKESNPTASISSTIASLWRRRSFRLGVLALFSYEVAEISINSLFINYATSDGWMDKSTASVVLSFGALGLFMLARIAGSWIMSRIAAPRVLAACAVLTVAGAIAVVLNAGAISHAGLFACYAFEAIMFPTIFAVTIAGISRSEVKIASSFLMMTPIGGAVGTSLMGAIADATSMSTAFIVPAVGYLMVLIYALSNLKTK